MSLGVANVSVIIPFFNSDSSIKRALISIFSQTMPVAEIIIVNDASNEYSFERLVEIVNEFSVENIKIINLERNVGAGGARNVGWNAATKKYIAFLDSDDVWLDEKICIQYKYMLKHENLIMTGHQSLCIEAGNKINVELKEIKYEPVTLSKLIFKNKFVTSSVMMKKDVDLRFLEEKRHSEDFLLWMMISKTGMCGVLKNDLSAMFKPAYGHSGLSANLIKMERGELSSLFFVYKKGFINILQFSASTVFSIFKFFIRYIVTKFGI